MQYLFINLEKGLSLLSDLMKSNYAHNGGGVKDEAETDAPNALTLGIFKCMVPGMGAES